MENLFTKEQIINGWKKACEKAISDKCFTSENSGTFNLDVDGGLISFLIRSTNTSKLDEKGNYIFTYSIEVIFENIVSYCSYELNSDEYNELADMFEKYQFKCRAEAKKEIIERNINALRELFLG